MFKSIFTTFLILLFYSSFSFSQSGNSLNTNKVQVSFPLSDDAEDTTTSYAKWTRDASQWQIKIVGAHSGSQAWVLQKGPGEVNGYTYITLSSGMDLSSTPNPYVQCWVKRSDGQGGYISLQASSDGGTTWNNLIATKFYRF